MSGAAYQEIEPETHRWQIVKLDSAGRIQGYVENVQVDFKLLGYTTVSDPNYFATPPTITPTTSGAWTTVDVSGHVDANADGVILFIDSISGSDRDFAIREVGSSFNTTNMELEQYGSTMYLVGLNGSGQFEAWIESTTVKIYLVAQTKGSVVYQTNDVTVSDPSTGLWQELDADSYSIPAEANGLIYRMENTSSFVDNKMGFRHVDSADNWNNAIGDGTHLQGAVGLRGDNAWGEFLQGTTLNVFIAAYTKGPAAVVTAATPSSDLLEFDQVKAKDSHIIQISGNVYAVAYAGDGDDGFLKTVSIAADGQITDTVIDNLEFDTSKGKTPNIIHISGDVYAIAYAGEGDDGFLKTVTIAATGQITNTVIDTLEFDTSKGNTPDIIQVSGDVYAIAYAGNGDDGFLKTLAIASNGQITNTVIDTLEFDTGKGKTPNIIPVSGSVYAVAYAGDNDDGFLKTVTITSAGQITNTVIDTLEFDNSKGKTPNIIPVSGSVYAVAYAGDNDDGFLKTVTITSAGQITNTVINTLEFDNLAGKTPKIITISGDVYAIAYTGNGDDGFLKTVLIPTLLKSFVNRLWEVARKPA